MCSLCGGKGYVMVGSTKIPCICSVRLKPSTPVDVNASSLALI